MSDVCACPECGVVLEGFVPVEVVEAVERELRTYRARLTRARNELAEKAARTQDRATITDVADHWRKACNHPRAVVEPGGKIAGLIHDRLDGGFTVPMLKRAIDGYAAFPYAGPKGRARRQYPGAKRYDGLELAMRDDDHVQKGLAMADRSDGE